ASSAWNWIRSNVFTPFGRAIDAIGKAFRKVGDVIGKAWGKIKEAAAKPVNFVIETVYMKGIKGTWDKIAGSVGLDLKLPTVKIGRASCRERVRKEVCVLAPED